jgi:hypothetical protein
VVGRALVAYLFAYSRSRAYLSFAGLSMYDRARVGRVQKL